MSIDEVKKLLNDKLSYAQIGKILGKSAKTISRFCKNNNLELKKIEYNETIICEDCKISFIGKIKDNRKFCSTSCSTKFYGNIKSLNNVNNKKRIRVKKIKTNEFKYKELSEDDFINICINSSSMSEAASRMDISYNKFRNLSKKLNCFKVNQAWSKGKTSFSDNRIKSKYDESIFIENSKINRSSIKSVIIRQKIFDYECKICKINEWVNKPLSLHLDHINGIRNDNRLENLRFLCPNCHSQTDTYCGGSKSDKKTLSSYTIDEIINKIKESETINICISSLGLLLTETNKSKINQIKDKYELSFKEVNKIIKIPSIINTKPPIIKTELKVCKCDKKLRPDNISGLCRKCLSKTFRKVNRPSYKDLLKDLSESNFSSVSKKYGVSDNCIRKWIKIYEKLLEET